MNKKTISLFTKENFPNIIILGNFFKKGMKEMFKLLNRSRYIQEITKEEMKKIIKEIENVVILDVRSPQEYKEGHVAGAINIPVYEIERKAAKFIKNKGSVIVAYCSAGIRSRRALEILKKQGYKNLYNVKEGY